MPDLHRKHTAIMFTDIVGYTTLMGSDEDRAFEVLRKNREIHSKLIKQFKGTLIKEMGDGMLISFNLASEAVRCAIEIQKVCKKQDIPLKIGIHEGEMVFEGNDVLGDGVNIASRIQDDTEEGCIMISGSVYRDIKNKSDIQTKFIEEKRYKNVDDAIKIYQVSGDELLIQKHSSKNTYNSHKDRKSFLVLKYIKPKTALIIILTVAVVLLLYPKIVKNDKFQGIRDQDGKISLAIMPFENLSGDSLFNVWQGGFQNLLITTLSNSEELSVRQYQTMHSLIESKREVNLASITPSIASELASNLETRTFILGKILKAGDKIRINAQLVSTETEEIYKTYQVDGKTEDDIFALADSLSGLIKNYLEIKKLVEQYDTPVFSETIYTNSSEAYRYFIHGWNAFMELDFRPAIEWLSKAIEADPNFIAAYGTLSFTYMVIGNDKQAKYWCNMVYDRRDELPIKQKLMIDHLHAYYYSMPSEEISYLKQFLEIDQLNPSYWYMLGLVYYLKLQDYENAIINFEKALEIHKKWKSDFRNPWIYPCLGDSYHKINDHKKEKEFYELGLDIFPKNARIIQRQAICALSQGDLKKAEILISSYISLRKNIDMWPDAQIRSRIGNIYEEAGILDTAEMNYRQGLKLDPSNPERINALAWFLIKNDINANEGLELIQKAVELRPDNWYYLDTQGWGLYKLGRHEEALKMLKDAWEIRPFYDHEGYQHIQEVEKAISIQNN
jgi:class 3 adenylate cyclase/tetratricopeptide (TPR) repeat protein